MSRTASQIIFDTLADLGVEDCFCVVGGSAMHLDYALGTTERIKTHFHHHEQACAMAAEGYARYAGKPAAVCVTCGPGATNTLTGVMGAWVDSIPMIVVAGNVRYDVSVEHLGIPIRYRGIQEFGIVDSVKNMTKYAATLKDPKDARAIAKKAFDIAMDGRRGPVWIDVPLDVQNALVNDAELKDYIAEPMTPQVPDDLIDLVADKLAKAKRPCILFGSAITTSHLFDELEAFLVDVDIPVIGGAWLADILPLERDHYYGSSGNIGPRAGNFILENADLILALGNSLSFKQTGYDLDAFAPHAEIIMVDAEQGERDKLGKKVDLFLHGSLESFFDKTSKSGWSIKASDEWFEYCDALKDRFSPYEGGENADSEDRVNKYLFWKKFNTVAPNSNILVLGNSHVGLALNQIGKGKHGQRVIANCICGSMGYDLPAAIGVQAAAQTPVVCVTGDGSFMMNMQELETIRYQNLPIKIVVFENGGYGSMRWTEANFFGEFDFGSGPQSGVGFPDFEKIAYAFDIPYRQCACNADIDGCIDWVLENDGPLFLEVKETHNDPTVPRLVSKIGQDGKMTSPLLCELSPLVDDAVLEWALSPSKKD